ncbi:hypothetical protein WICPIJ_004755 [Wickerhamomyces pijperi]|uniref:Uncharacterized protein n=1 Tax=Wickerhamomyces pijperi TaxID=599730 RepID=A0A9P8Q7A2_WICPI|nr:hypothetical protein WICPIJ_004755 [Wickerhamomyces pijperi]
MFEPIPVIQTELVEEVLFQTSQLLVGTEDLPVNNDLLPWEISRSVPFALQFFNLGIEGDRSSLISGKLFVGEIDQIAESQWDLWS